MFVLTATLLVGTYSNSAYAESQSDSLIKIATQARDQLRIQLSQTDGISDDLKQLFEQGSSEILAIEKAAQENDVASARQHFLNAMKIFNNISQKISESSETAQSSQPASRLSYELDRQIKYVERLKEIVIKNSLEIDFTGIEEQIRQAKNALNEGNLDPQEIQQIKQSVLDINNSIKEKTSQVTEDKAKSFAQKHLEELDRLISQAKQLGISQNTIDRLIEARDNLDSASNVDQIIKEVKQLLSVKEQFQNSKIKRLQERINQLEDRLERISQEIDENDPDLIKAKNMIQELKEVSTSASVNELIQKINAVNELLKELENSITSDANASKETTENQSSLSDSKLERIEIKIQKLEDEMNTLSEQVKGNAAAERWLKNAFSLIDEAKSQISESPDDALSLIMKVEQILERIKNIIQ